MLFFQLALIGLCVQNHIVLFIHVVFNSFVQQVNQQFKETRLQVDNKQKALEEVVAQLEDLEKNKEEMQKLFHDVKRELSVSDEELEEEPVVVIRRQKLKV